VPAGTSVHLKSSTLMAISGQVSSHPVPRTRNFGGHKSWPLELPRRMLLDSTDFASPTLLPANSFSAVRITPSPTLGPALLRPPPPPPPLPPPTRRHCWVALRHRCSLTGIDGRSLLDGFGSCVFGSPPTSFRRSLSDLAIDLHPHWLGRRNPSVPPASRSSQKTGVTSLEDWNENCVSGAATPPP